MAKQGACMAKGGMCGKGGACVVKGVHGKGRVCVVKGGHAWQRGQCMGYHEIWRYDQ